MRKKRPLERGDRIQRDATLVVIASEDRYAVKQYFERFRSSRVQFQVLETSDCNSSPAQVMARLESYKQSYDFGEGDRFWLVCDLDHWANSGHIQNLTEVIRRCRQQEIGIALSSPCFEYWLLLHYQDSPNGEFKLCQPICDLLRSAAGGYDKTKVDRLPLTQDAVMRAVERARAEDAEGDSGVIPTKNQTAVYKIIEDLLSKGIVTFAA